MATCTNGRKGYRLCISQKCNEPAVLCRSEDCKCEDKHLNCRESLKVDLEISELNSRLVFRNQPTDKRLEDVLQRVRALPNAIPEGLKEWKAQVGLTSDQLRLLQQLAKPGQFSFSGSAVHKIDSLTPFPPKQAEQLVLRHIKNIEQMLTSTEQALRILLTLKVDNPIGPQTVKLSPAFFGSDKKYEQLLRQLQKSKSQQLRREDLNKKQSSKSNQYQCEIQNLRRHICELNQNLSRTVKEKSQLQSHINDNHRQNAHYKEQIGALQSHIVGLQQRTKGVIKNTEGQKKKQFENAKLKQQIDRLMAALAQNENKISVLMMEIERLNQILQQTRMENQMLKKKMIQNEKKTMDLMAGKESGNLKVSNDRELAMREEIQSLRRAMEQSEKFKKMIQQETVKMRKELEMHLKEKEVLKRELMQFKKMIQECQMRIVQMSKENERLAQNTKRLEDQLRSNAKK